MLQCQMLQNVKMLQNNVLMRIKNHLLNQGGKSQLNENTRKYFISNLLAILIISLVVDVSLIKERRREICSFINFLLEAIRLIV